MVDIRIEGVTKKFGNATILNHISLTVQEGRFAVLLGPSGCGKTTLLRCVAGLERVDGGNVFLGGELVNDIPARERDLSMVFQGFSLFPLMTVAENIGFPLKVRHASKQAVDARVKEVSALLGIEALLGKLPKELSGGEQQRVAIGRAIAREPKGFLMDEPLSSLDAPLRAQLRSELKRVQRQIGVTTLYVTHDQGEAVAMADKIGVMNRGHLLQYDDPLAVFQHPSSSFVARFVGEPQANIVDAVVSGGGRSVQLGTDGGVVVSLPDGAASALAKIGKGPGSPIAVSIRPEDIRLSESPGAGEGVRGSVILDEPGSLFRVVTVGTGSLLLRVVVPKEMTLRQAQDVWLRFNPESLRFFDKDDGRSLSA